MSAFEWGLAIGAAAGLVIGFCVAVVLVKLEGRRERKMGYVTVTRFDTGYAKPYISGAGSNPQREYLSPLPPPKEGAHVEGEWRALLPRRWR